MSKKPNPWWRKDRKAWFVQIKGKRHNLGSNKELAFQRYHELMAEPQSRLLSSESVVAIFDKFLEFCRNNRAHDTYEWYRSRLQDFIQTLPKNLSIAQFRPYHVTDWINRHSDWSNGSKRNACRAVQRAMNWALEDELIEQNPVAYLKKPRGGKRDTVISPEEFETILTFVNDPGFRDLLITTWETGCRPQESLRVEARHVDLRNCRWVFSETEAKTGMPRVVYLPENALKITRRMMELHSEGPLFRNSRGDPWTTESVNCAFIRLQITMGKAKMKQLNQTVEAHDIRKFAKSLNKSKTVQGEIIEKTEIDLFREARQKLMNRLATQNAPKYCLYTLRHSWATHAMERGLDALTVAILMGHKDPSVLAKTYQHLSLNPKHLLEQARKAID